MKNSIIYLIIFCMVIYGVSAATMTRDMPTTANPGQSFTVRYITTDAAGNFGVLIEDDVTGGCTPNHIATGFLSPATYTDLAFTAPSSSGSCTFTGNYQFSDAGGAQPEVNFPSQTVTISGTPVTTTTTTLPNGGNGGTTCEETLDCEIWEECDDAGTDCEIAAWVFMAGGIMAFMMFWSMMK